MFKHQFTNNQIFYFFLLDINNQTLFHVLSIVCKTTDQKETNGDENGDKYEIPDQNKECVFPFQYRGETFDSCTNFGCPECFWCGTQYDVTDTTGWGICNEACPTLEYVESKRLI